MSWVRLSRRWLLALSFAGPVARGAVGHAAEAGAEAMIDRLTRKAVHILKTTEMNSPKRQAELQALLETGFDLPYLAQLAVGRSWRELSAAERQDFIRIFTRWVLETQSARLSQYAGEAIVIRNSQPVGEGDTMISTEIQGGKLQQPIQVDWRVRERDGDYRIIDVLIAGVSMVVTYRNEFQAIVERGGAEALKAELAARAGKS
jgi:phospholipid transport system substrate-binding protein